MDGGKEMKNMFFKIMAGAAVISTLASCNLNDFPNFNDKDAFVAFDKTSYTVDETVGTITIPVTLASVCPIETAVTYEVVDGTAKAGENYSLADDSAVLRFEGKDRTQNIVINITDKTGEYSGDLSFTINILSGGKSVNLGDSATCTVKINDLDHPLADILGEYTCTAEDKGAGSVSWTMRMSKDPDDVTVVWVDYICPLAASNPGMKFSVYGNVSEDHKTITFPCGQKPGALYAADDPFTFIWFSYEGGYVVKESGNVTMVSETPGVFTTEDGMGFCSTQYVFNGGMILKGSAVWTKK